MGNRAGIPARGTLVLVAALLTAGLLAACQASNPTPSVTGAAPSAAEAPATAEEQKAIAFRVANSLPADLAHVRAVAGDPSATTEFGVPLLPAETAELMSRSANADAVIQIVEAEGARTPNDYCGLYIDNANGGAVTSGWTQNRAIHELTIRGKVRPTARIAFIDCRFSEVQVNRVCDLIGAADFNWMRAIPARIQGLGCGNKNFRAEMQISSAQPGAADVVLQHYTALFNLPPGILAVTSDGTGAALVPRGTVRITVLGTDGKPVGPNDLFLDWKALDLPGIDCGSEVGYGVPADGEPIDLPCQAGAWRIAVKGAPAPDQDNIEYGVGTVVVKAGVTVRLTIRLAKDPPPRA